MKIKNLKADKLVLNNCLTFIKLVILIVNITLEVIMNNINQSAFDASSSYILNNARYLEKILLGHYFISPCSVKIVKALKMYQNKDGGYGNGLEPDFRMSFSSPMATSIALRLLSEFSDADGVEEQIKSSVQYLESTYNEVFQGWERTSKMVNLFPHAPWWTYEEPIYGFGGNPSAEIVGYLYKFRNYLKKLDIIQLKDVYINKLISSNTKDEHELMCYIRMYNHMSDVDQDVMLPYLNVAYHQIVNINSNEWNNYTPYPLKFIELTQNNMFEVPNELINENLQFLLNKLSLIGHIVPPWSWSSYLEEWETAKREWTGILTLDALLILRRFKVL